jgi:hypothetical protein
MEGDVYTGGFPEGFRLQQLIPGEWLADVPSSTREIAQIAFRPSQEVTEPLDIPVGHVTIRLSTTQTQPGAMSLTYAENSGPDETVVFEQDASFTTQNQLSANGITKEFDMVFPLTSPFAYDPTAGNLLVDMMVELTPEVTEIADLMTDFALLETGDLAGAHLVGHNASAEAGPPTAAMADASYVGGNILQIAFVPEPSSAALAIISLVFGGGLFRHSLRSLRRRNGEVM